MLFSNSANGDMAAIVCDDSELRGFRIQKAGNYFYIRMKNFFDSLNLDYVGKRVSYDIIETPERYDDKIVFKFKRGIFERRSGDNPTEEETIA